VKDTTVTLSVVGPILKGSLVMGDSKTGTLWSQLLGDCIEGELKGESLEALPCDMVTWQAWRREHPDTTVLDMSRTSKNYSKEYYESRGGPAQFCVGTLVDYEPHHCTFATLKKQPLLNLEIDDEELLLTFDAESTSARLFSRTLDERVLTFAAGKNGLISDEQTSSSWNRMTGIAVDGPLKGKQLDHRVGIMSYTKKWKDLHPESKEIPRT